MKIRKSMNVSTGLLAAALVTYQPSVTQADEPTSADMTEMASDYSMENGGRVGIFLNIAPDTQYTPDQIGKAMVTKFAEAGIEAAYIFNHTGLGKSSVTYYMNGNVWPGYSLGAAPQAFEEVVRSYRALKAMQTKPTDELVRDAQPEN